LYKVSTCIGELLYYFQFIDQFYQSEDTNWTACFSYFILFAYLVELEPLSY